VSKKSVEPRCSTLINSRLHRIDQKTDHEGSCRYDYGHDSEEQYAELEASLSDGDSIQNAFNVVWSNRRIKEKLKIKSLNIFSGSRMATEDAFVDSSHVVPYSRGSACGNAGRQNNDEFFLRYVYCGLARYLAQDSKTRPACWFSYSASLKASSERLF